MSRKAEREQAFIVIFEKSLNDGDLNEILADAREILEWKESVYVDSTTAGVFQNLETIDELISSKLKEGWSIARLSKVALALMRLAVYEMNYNDEVPDGVAINEAVELCKVYATETDASYLNGVLGALSREKEK